MYQDAVESTAVRLQSSLRCLRDRKRFLMIRAKIIQIQRKFRKFSLQKKFLKRKLSLQKKMEAEDQG